MSNVATYVRDLEGWAGDAKLYSLNPPIKWTRYDNEGNEQEETAGHVVVSAVVAFNFTGFGGGPETYIFPATGDGEVVSWGELDGSFRGELNHKQALKGAGYEIATT